jgi:hypothetical protein
MMMTEDKDPNCRREIVEAAIREQNTPIGKMKNFARGIMILLFLPVQLCILALFVSIMVGCGALCLPCMCMAMVSRRGDEEARGFALGMLMALLCSPVWVPLVVVTVIFTQLRAATFLLLCCRTPPPPRQLNEAGHPVGSPGEVRFGAMGGERLEEEIRGAAMAAERMTPAKEGAVAAAASATSAHEEMV